MQKALIAKYLLASTDIISHKKREDFHHKEILHIYSQKHGFLSELKLPGALRLMHWQHWVSTSGRWSACAVL